MKFRVLSSLLWAGALLLAAQVASAGNSVRSISLEAPAAGVARLQLQLAAPPRQKVFTVDKTPDNPQRIVIALPGTALAQGLRLPASVGPVRALRSGQQADGSLHLVLELDRDLVPQVTASGTQLTVELGAMPVVGTVAAPPAPVRAEHAPVDAGRNIIVAVDAGHGGIDDGTSGAMRTREKDVTLAIALALAKLINAEPGMTAYLTRDSDKYIPLPTRVDLARRARADIFISVHADAFPRNHQVSGSSVYVLSSGRASSEAANWLADQENAVDLKGGIPLAKMDDALASVLMDVTQTASITASMEAAERLLAQLDRIGTVRKSLVQRASFAVLTSPDIPSVLVETAYLSNPAEEKKLRTASYQAQVAAAIFTGVRDYFRQSPPDGTLFARQRAASRTASTVVADSASP